MRVRTSSDFLGCFHGAYLDAGFAFKAQFVVNKGSVLDKTDGSSGAQINTAAAADTFFSVNTYHDEASYNKSYSL